MRWALGIALVSIFSLIIPINSVSADEIFVPDWVKTTVTLWSEGKISHTEFVNSLEYLMEQDIIKFSGSANEKILRDNEYLQAKAEVFRDEAKQLREENKEYRILLKSQELTQGELPAPFSNMFNENQRLQNEVRALRELNNQFSTQINSWITNNMAQEFNVSTESRGGELIQVDEYQNEINSLQKQNVNYEKQMKDLKNLKNSLQKKVDFLYSENENSKSLLNAIKERNQENRNQVNQLLLQRDNYAQRVSQLEVENFDQQVLIKSSQEELGKFDGTIQTLAGEKSKSKRIISQIQEENSKFQSRVTDLEAITNEQMKSMVAILTSLDTKNQLVNTLQSNIVDHKSEVESLKVEKSQLGDLVVRLESENDDRLKSLVSISGAVQESNEFMNSLNYEIAEYKKLVLKLEGKNTQYQNQIKVLVSEQPSYENVITDLGLELSNQKDSSFAYQVKVDEANKLINLQNSKILGYQNTIQILENKNSQFETLLLNVGDENTATRLIEQEKLKFHNLIETLKSENENMRLQLRHLEDIELEKEIDVHQLSSENELLRYEINDLQSDLEQKLAQLVELRESKQSLSSVSHDTTFDTIANEVSLLDFKIQEYQDQVGRLTKQSVDYLVELNYLTAKNLVNAEEMDMLRTENEEYRVLLNLMKKGVDYNRFASVKYDSIRDGYSGEGVIVYNKFDDTSQKLLSDTFYNVDTSKEYLIYVEPVPEWSEDISYLVDEAVEFWQSVTGAKFRLVESFDATSAKISWYKQLPNGYDGFVIRERLVQIGLGNNDCDGAWRPYDTNSVRKVLIHEIGHVMGLEHTNDQSSLMYPVIHNARYSTITEFYTLGAGEAVFIGGCSLNQEPSYQFEVAVQDSENKIDLFFVTSKNEYFQAINGKPFQYYSDPNCLGLSRSVQMGICESVSHNAGLLIIAPDSISGEQITVKVSLAER
ncbi:MAG: matrixin family metalloprotease [Thaumarchaeota archaeon]|nr:matrixin family metalloprotease [Nitrososphaerota archaeon]